MAGRMVDVPGLSVDAVLISTATQEAYGDTPADRLALIRSWVASGDCTPAEVVSAMEAAQVCLVEDPEADEMAQAVVVLSRVVRAVYPG